MATVYKLYIEGPDEDSIFKYTKLPEALDKFDKWCRDPRNIVTLFEVTDKTERCLKVRD